MIHNTQLILYKPSVVLNGYFQDTSATIISDGGTQPWIINYYGDTGIIQLEKGYALATPGAAASISQAAVAVVGVQYRVKLTVSSRTAGSLSIYFGSTLSNTISANGDYTYLMTADPNLFAVDDTIADFNIETDGVFDGKISKVSVIPTPTDYFVDLTADLDIPLTFTIADIREPDKRKSSFSKTVVLPGTKHNNQIFGEIFEISAEGIYNPNKAAHIVVIEDGVQTFSGNLQITDILRDQSGHNTYDLVHYEVLLLGTLGDFFSKIKDKFLTDLDFSEYNHNYDVNTIEDSWIGSITTGGTFGLAPGMDISSITYYTDATGVRVKLNFATPHSFVISDYLNIEINQTGNTQINGYQSIYLIPNNTSIVLNYGWGSLTNPTSLMASSVSVISGYGCAKMTFTGEGYVYPMIDYDGGGNSYLSTSSFWAVNKFFPAIYLKTYIDKIFQYAGYTYDCDLFDSQLFKRLIVPYASPATPIIDPFTLLPIVLGGYMDLNNTIKPAIKMVDFIKDIIVMFNLYIQEDKLNNKKLYIRTRPEFYSGTDIVDWTEKLDISQQMKIKPMGDLNGKAYTYSYKEDNDFLNDDHQKDTGYTYGYENHIVDNDFMNSNVDTKLTVFSATPIYGSTQNYASKDNFYLSFMAKGPSFAFTNTNLRLLFYGPKGTDNTQFWNFNGTGNPSNGLGWGPPSGPSFNNNFSGQYPYAGHLDNVFGPTVDLNFSYPIEVYYSVTSWTNNNLYNAYYSDFIFDITNKNSKVITVKLRLKPFDIFDLDFRRLFLIDGHYLRLNKITDYSVASDGLTECEFLKIDTGIRPSFSSMIISAVDLTPAVSMSALRTTRTIFTASRMLAGNNLVFPLGDTTSRMGTGNTIGSGTGIDVVGDDNTVGLNVSNILIKGSNNTVGDNLSDITIINTDNITATMSGETWISGVYYSPSGTVSNLSISLIDAGTDEILSPFNTDKLTNFIEAGSDIVLDFGGAEIIHLIDGGEDKVI